MLILNSDSLFENVSKSNIYRMHAFNPNDPDPPNTAARLSLLMMNSFIKPFIIHIKFVKHVFVNMAEIAMLLSRW